MKKKLNYDKTKKNGDKIWKLEFGQNLKKLKLWQNSNSDKTQELKLW